MSGAHSAGMGLWVGADDQPGACGSADDPMILLSRLPCSECKTQCSNGKCEISQRYSEGSAWSAYLVSPPVCFMEGLGWKVRPADAPCLAASRPYVWLVDS